MGPPSDHPDPASALGRSDSVDDPHAAADLLPLVYDELRKLARARLAAIPPGQTLQPTALVHDVYLKLVGDKDPGWNGRAHFFGAAARAMRELLVDAARRKSRLKHGGDLERVDLGENLSSSISLEVPVDDFLALDAALDRLQCEHRRVSEVVMLRQFAGLTNPAIAEVIGVSRGTVDRDWRFALAWLHKEMNGSDEGTP